MECYSLAHVFFKGYGCWVTSILIGELYHEADATDIYQATGVFKLSSENEAEYKYTEKVSELNHLLPCSNLDDEFRRSIRDSNLRHVDFYNIALDYDPKHYYFRLHEPSHRYIGYEFRVIDSESSINEVEPDNINKNQSEKLKILIEASNKFWSNADPEDNETHPKSSAIEIWLKEAGYSNSNAEQGAIIIRPTWAVKGRRSTD